MSPIKLLQKYNTKLILGEVRSKYRAGVASCVFDMELNSLSRLFQFFFFFFYLSLSHCEMADSEQYALSENNECLNLFMPNNMRQICSKIHN